MDDPCVVRLCERCARLEHVVDDLGIRETTAPRALGLEVGAIEELHDHVGEALGRMLDVGDLYDMTASERRGCTRFAIEALHDLVDTDQIGVQQLDGDRLPEPQMLGGEHDAHAPLTEHTQQAIFAGDGLAGLRNADRSLSHPSTPSLCRPRTSEAYLKLSPMAPFPVSLHRLRTWREVRE